MIRRLPQHPGLGLLDVLIRFSQNGQAYIVKNHAVGSGAAMTMGDRGKLTSFRSMLHHHNDIQEATRY